MTQQEHIQGETTSPDPTLITVCTVATTIDVIKRTLNLLDGQGIAVDSLLASGPLEDQTSRLLYKALNEKSKEIHDVQQ